MRAPSPRLRKIAGLSAAPVAVLVAGVLVWQGSTAAFTATTGNTDNSWSTGQVALTDDDQGRAAFAVENLVPGAKGQNCITVTSNSTVPGTVKIYGADFTSNGKGLEEHIDITIARGTGGGWGDCTGFQPAGGYQTPALSLSTIATHVNDYGDYTGGPTWTTNGTGVESAVYRLLWAFDTTGLSPAEINELQGATAGADIVWELQSNKPNS